MVIKNKEELEILKEAGAKLRAVLDELEKQTKPGVSTKYLDDLARQLIEKLGAKPSFLNYKPSGHTRPYPATICASVNEEVVHGIPNESEKILKEGDIVTLDCGLWFGGLCVDSARTVKVGNVSSVADKLYSVAKAALYAQIEAAKVGAKVYELGKVVEEIVEEAGFYSPDILGGHGVGKAVHEDPFIPNFYDKSMNYTLKEGEVLALEPIVIEGTYKVLLDKDGYTYKSADNSWSAQFEHTIVVTDKGAEIIT